MSTVEPDGTSPPIDLLRDIVERPTGGNGVDRAPRRPVRVASTTRAFPHYDPTVSGGPSRYALKQKHTENSLTPVTTSAPSATSAAVMASCGSGERVQTDDDVRQPSATNTAVPSSSTGNPGVASDDRIVVEDLIRLQISCFQPRCDKGGASSRLGVEVMQYALQAHRSTESLAQSGEVPVAVHDVDFVDLVVKCLRSTVWQHRLSALEALLRELSSIRDDDNDDCDAKPAASPSAAAKMLREFFLFGPECALRMRVLVDGLAHSHPREFRCRVLVIWLLLRDSCDGVPHAITDLGAAAQGEEGESGDASRVEHPSREEGGLDISEVLRTNLPRALHELALARNLLQNVAPLATWALVFDETPHTRQAFRSSTTGGTSRDDTWTHIQTVFWGVLTVCVTEEGADETWSWPSLQTELLLAFQRAILADQPLVSVVPVLLFLRRACQFKRLCLHLAPKIRPLLLLLLHRAADSDRNAESFDVHVLTWTVLRHMLRHGCYGLVEEFAEVLIRGTSFGSLAVVETAVLAELERVAEGRLSDDMDRMARECALSALRYASQCEGHEIWSPLSTTSSAPSDELWQWKSLRLSTALHYLATYASVANTRVLLLVGPAAQTQEYMQHLIASKLVGPEALGSYFPSLQGAGQHHHDDGGSGNSRPRARVASLPAALLVGQTYSLTRWLCSAATAMPACRVVVAGFLASVLAKFVDAVLSTATMRSVGSIRLSVEELSTALEAIAFFHDPPEMTILSGRTLLLASAMTLQFMSKSTLCWDAVPLVATVLIAQVRHGAAPSDSGDERQRAVACVVAAVRGDEPVATDEREGQRLARSDAKPHSSAGWLSRLLPAECSLLWSNLVERILSTNQDTKYFFSWDRLLVDALLWSVRFPGDAVSRGLSCLLTVLHGEALLPLDAGRALCVSLASWAQPERGMVLRIEATATLSLLLLTAAPATSIAVMRVLGATKASFDETVTWAEKSARDAHWQCARLFSEESLSALNERRRRALLLHSSTAVASGVASTAIAVQQRNRDGSSSSSWRWCAQDVLEFLEAASCPLRRWHPDAWPAVATRSLLRLLCIGSSAHLTPSSFLRSPWTEFEAEAITSTVRECCPQVLCDSVTLSATKTCAATADGNNVDVPDDSASGDGRWVGDGAEDEFDFY